MATTYSIKAEPRTLLGKKAKRLMRQGYVPGVVFRSNGVVDARAVRGARAWARATSSRHHPLD
jgi:ribosomal protein L25 (general stress protein Ctc)